MRHITPSPVMTPVQHAYHEFVNAYQAWSTNLCAVNGTRAGDGRYTAVGKTHPLCAASYAEFVRTGDCWRKLVAAEHQHEHARHLTEKGA